MKAKTLTLLAKATAVLYALVASLGFKISATDVVIVATFIANSTIAVDVSLISKVIKG